MASQDVSLTDIARGYARALHDPLCPWREVLRSRGFTPETAARARLGWVNQPAEGHEKFQGCLSIPYHLGDGRTVSTFSFRRPEGVKPKYDKERGKPAALYGVQYVDEPIVYLTEGELDALVLRQMGLAAIGVPGATNFKPGWKLLFRDTDKVVVVFDGDEAGRKAANKIARQVGEVTRVDIADMPEGEDANSLYLKNRKELESVLGLC